MTTFRVFFLVMKKNIGTVMLYVGIFLALCIFFTASDNDMGNFEVSKAAVGISDEDKSQISQALVDYLSETQKVCALSSKKDKMTDALFNGDVEFIIVIPERFGENLLAGKGEGELVTYTSPDSMADSFLKMQVEEFVGAYSFYLQQGEKTQEALEKARENVKIEAQVELAGRDTSQKPDYFYFFQYLAYIFICVTITGIGPVLVCFGRKDLSERLTCSPESSSKRSMNIFAAMLVVGVGLYILFVLLGRLLFQGTWEHAAGYLILAGLFLFVSVSLTFLLSSFLKTNNSLTMMSNILGLGMSFLGGIFVPMEFMGDKVIRAAHLLPTYWYMIGLEKVQASHSSGYLGEITSSIGVLLIYGFVLLAAGLLCKRRRA